MKALKQSINGGPSVFNSIYEQSFTPYALPLTVYVLLAGLVILLSACNTNQASRIEPTQTAMVQTEATPPALPPTPAVTVEPPTATSTAIPVPTEEAAVPQGAEPAIVTGEPTEPTLEPAEPLLSTTVEPLPTMETEPAIPASSEVELPTEALPPTELPALAVASSLDSLEIKFTPIAGDFTKPLFVTHAGDGSGRLFVVEQAGRILVIEQGQVNPTPFLDIVSIVGSDGNEQGLLSVAFHPSYPKNGFFFVDYTDTQGDTVIARYEVSADPNVADPASAKILLTIDQPYANHNGGQLVFGPDGYLYIGMGDGGAAGDPNDNGQNPNSLLGKILRIDVDSADPYGIPSDNPFATNGQGSPEIWSYGWRNPWRFSFDQTSGDMYVGDVGQNEYEEVDVELAGTPSGQNYGWRLMEGLHCYDPSTCDPTAPGLVLPVVEYDHSQGCSVTGGYVYRGTQFPTLTGVYFYGDYCSGIVWGLRREADGNWSKAELSSSGYLISSFGQDEAGEVYLVHQSTGEIFQIGN